MDSINKFSQLSINENNALPTENTFLPVEGELVEAIIESSGIFGIFVKFAQNNRLFNGFVFWTNTIYAMQTGLPISCGDILEERFQLYPAGKQIKCIVLPITFIGQQFQLMECE